MGEYRCRICQSPDCIEILGGSLPLAADVRTAPSTGLPRYPLSVVRCAACGHIQLKEAAPVDLYAQYLFTPSYMAEFSSYLELFCRRLNSALGPEREKSVLEIGSSNGSLLKRLKAEGWKVLGIEPSAPMAEAARRQDVDTVQDYFGAETLGEIRKRIGRPGVVVLRHVLEHLERPDEIIFLIREVLGDGGLLVVEVPHVQKTIQEKRFYDFYHEHLSYFSVTVLKRLLTLGGFRIRRVYESPEVGGSILVFADSGEAAEQSGNVEKYLEEEKKSLSEERIRAFSKEVSGGIARLKEMAEGAKARGKTLAGWGAGQRGCTLIARCGFQSDSLRYVIDANENYWNRYVPGTDIPIVPPGYYREHMVDEMMIFATGYADSIIQANGEFERLGGSFLRISAI